MKYYYNILSSLYDKVFAFVTILLFNFWYYYQHFSVHYFIVLMEFLFLSFHRPAPGAAAGAACLLQACFTRIVTRLLAIRTCAGPFSKGSHGEGLEGIKLSVFISGCQQTGSAGSLPSARRCGNRPLTIVRLAAGSRHRIPPLSKIRGERPLQKCNKPPHGCLRADPSKR